MLDPRSSKSLKEYQRLASHSVGPKSYTIPLVQFGTIPKKFKPTALPSTGRTQLAPNQPPQPIARARLRTQRLNPAPANAHVEPGNVNNLRGQNQLEFVQPRTRTNAPILGAPLPAENVRTVKPNQLNTGKARKLQTQILRNDIESNSHPQAKVRMQNQTVDPQIYQNLPNKVHPNLINPAETVVPRKRFYKKMRIPFIN